MPDYITDPDYDALGGADPDYDADGAPVDDADQGDSEMTSDDDLGPASAIPDPPMLLARIDDRPARLVSFEQEIGGESEVLAERLYEHGFTSEPTVYPYHAHTSEWLHVEEDGSVDGEVIYSRLRLNEPRIARKVADALAVVQASLQDGSIRLDSRCGFHVHVGIGADDRYGARAYGMGSVQSLYHLWNYVEDVVYRLASANWRYHRTERGNGYASPTEKGLSGTVSIGRHLSRARAAINFAPYLASRAECSCGAFQFGDWSECSCDHLRKPTVEFRVFNATANTRKIRGYVALCSALVAYAETHTVEPERFPVASWRGTTRLDAAQASERLRFILRDLPLTDAERDDLRYCAEQAPGLGPVVKGIRRRRGHGSAALSNVRGS